MRYRLALTLAIVALLAVGNRVFADAGDTFFEALVLSPGVTSTDDELLFSNEYPTADLLLGTFDSDGNLTYIDDDGSDLGDGRAPALFDVPINPGGEIDFALTGTSDTDFTGDHAESGAYQADVTILDSEGEPISGFLYDGFLGEGAVDTYFESAPEWEGGTYQVTVNNTIPNDVDFFRFTGMAPGAAFSAETGPGSEGNEFLDTVIAWFDESGDIIASDDDEGVDLFSKLSGVVPANGEVVIAVSGFSDFSFDGSHGESGAYELIITLTGDYDFDGDIDDDDYDAWRNTYGQTGEYLAADGNGDGGVDAADYTVWRDALESTTTSDIGPSPAAGVAVPEPNGALLLLVVSSITLLHRNSLGSLRPLPTSGTSSETSQHLPAAP